MFGCMNIVWIVLVLGRCWKCVCCSWRVLLSCVWWVMIVICCWLVCGFFVLVLSIVWWMLSGWFLRKCFLVLICRRLCLWVLSILSGWCRMFVWFVIWVSLRVCCVMCRWCLIWFVSMVVLVIFLWIGWKLILLVCGSCWVSVVISLVVCWCCVFCGWLVRIFLFLVMIWLLCWRFRRLLINCLLVLRIWLLCRLFLISGVRRVVGCCVSCWWCWYIWLIIELEV